MFQLRSERSEITKQRSRKIARSGLEHAKEEAPRPFTLQKLGRMHRATGELEGTSARWALVPFQHGPA